MNARDGITPLMRPFHPATSDFVSGTDSPREFLERCIADLNAWEPKIGAFVAANLVAAREAADRSTERWRAGNPLSPIDGIPIGVKDIMETIQGNRIWKNRLQGGEGRILGKASIWDGGQRDGRVFRDIFAG